MQKRPKLWGMPFAIAIPTWVLHFTNYLWALLPNEYAMWKITLNTIFKSLLAIVGIMLGWSCQGPSESPSAPKEERAWQQNAYANNFKLHSSTDSVFLEIQSPVAQQFISYAFRKYSVQEIALSNSVQWSFLKLLVGEADLPGAVAGHKYFCDSLIHEAVKEQTVRELRGAESIDEEQMILSGCKLLLQDGFNQRVLSAAGQKPYQELFIMEWKENHPLARLEWIKVLGALVGQEQQAANIFEKKRMAYEKAQGKFCR